MGGGAAVIGWGAGALITVQVALVAFFALRLRLSCPRCGHPTHADLCTVLVRWERDGERCGCRA